MKWISVDDDPPDKSVEILCCSIHWYAPVAARFKTFHPNAKGVKCWRTFAGIKVEFTHWTPLLEPPK